METVNETNQQAFLNTVAKALGRHRPLTKPPERNEVGPPVFWREQKFENNQPFELFKKNLEGLTGKVVVVTTAREATQQIMSWLKELNAQRVIMWDHPELKQYVMLNDSEYQVDYWEQGRDSRELIETAERADVGITWADYGIGYTGTVALFAGPGRGRSVSLLPPTHIAVFKKSQIVPTMSAVMRAVVEHRDKKVLPSAVDFITGPSRTSDIEMDLSIGVHGPIRMWTVVIDEVTPL